MIRWNAMFCSYLNSLILMKLPWFCLKNSLILDQKPPWPPWIGILESGTKLCLSTLRLHDIASHRIASHKIVQTSHRIASHHIQNLQTSHRIASYQNFDITTTLPATSANCERAFSTLTDVVTKKRNRLEAETTEKLTFCKHNVTLIPDYKTNRKLSTSDIEDENMSDIDVWG